MSALSDMWPEKRAALQGQADAAHPEANAWVAANAGSGKTKVLIDRVARLLLRDVKPDSILCVTYTKAAASEMQDRLFGRLGGWCVAETGKLRDELSKLEDRPPESFTEEELGRARELFAQALETPGGLRIETIHAFCGRVLRRFPLEASVAPGFQELDDEAADELWDDAMRALGARVAEGRRDLVEAARVVAEAGGGGLNVVRALNARRALVDGFIRQHGGVEKAVIALKRQLRAPDETVEQLLKHAMGAGLARGNLQTLTALIPAVKASDVELARILAFVLSEAPAEERHAAYRAIAFTGSGDPRKSNCYTAEALKAAPALAQLFQAKDSPQGSEVLRMLELEGKLAARRTYERSAALLRLASVVFQDFARRKDARAGLDFDDLIDATNRLLTRRAAAEWVLWKLDGGIAHVLLDEAQDTSPAQWSILRSLTADIFAGAGAERLHTRTLFVVGDEKQSIYSFQGADPEEFLRQGRRIDTLAREAQVTLNAPHLAMSFRSVSQVLDFVDETFDPARFAPQAPFSLQVPIEADYARHDAHRREHGGCVDLWPLEPRPLVDDPDPWDAPLDQQSQTAPAVRLAKQIAEFIKRQLADGAAIWDGAETRPCTPGDFLILVKRRTGGLFDAILQALKVQQLPVAGADRIQLLESLPVQDLLNLVRFALCPEDDLILAEILKGPFGGLDDDDLLELAWSRKGSLWREVETSTSAKTAPAHAFLADVLARRGEAPFEFLTRALERPVGHTRAGWELILSRFGDPAKEPVTALIDRAMASDAAGPASLESFLAAVEHHGGEVKRELSGPQDEVRVMTVHGAKGLQAPVVILPDTTSAPRLDKSGLFIFGDTEDNREAGVVGAPVWAGPKGNDTAETAAMRQESDDRALREHRRLLYVALTRAQDRLLVCGAWYGASKAGRDKESWYALCEEGMAQLASRGEAHEVEEDGRKLMRFGEAPEKLSRQGELNVEIPEPAWLRSPAPLEAAASRILSPSSLMRDQSPPLAPFGGNREARLRRGRLIHTLLQVLPDIAPRSRRKAAADFLKRQPELTKSDREEMAAAAMRVLEDEQFAHVFAPGGRAEAPIIGRLGGDIVNGRVDRLVVTDGEILLVDFKTDRPAPDSVSGVGEAYRKQMDAYTAVLTNAWPGRHVRRLLVWTDGPKLMEI